MCTKNPNGFSRKVFLRENLPGFVLIKPDGSYATSQEVFQAVQGMVTIPLAIGMDNLYKAVRSLMAYGYSYYQSLRKMARESEMQQKGSSSIPDPVISTQSKFGTYGYGREGEPVNFYGYYLLKEGSGYQIGKYFGDTINAKTWVSKGYVYCLYPKAGFRKSKFKTKKGRTLYYKPVSAWKSDSMDYSSDASSFYGSGGDLSYKRPESSYLLGQRQSRGLMRYARSEGQPMY